MILFMERKKSITITKIVRKSHVSIFMLSIWILIFVSVTASAITSCLDTRCPTFFKSERDFQKVKEEIVKDMVFQGKTTKVSMSWSRRLLSGPGSFPPRCNSKCGKCTPCRPVHVPVPPGTPVTAEYYPEAWRCKCGNRLYMP